MSKFISSIKAPNYLDSILLVVLALRLLLGAAVESIRYSVDFGVYVARAINPFWNIDLTIAEGSASSWVWWFCTQWQGIFFVGVVALILTGRKKAASIVAIFSVLLPTFLLAFVYAAMHFPSDFFYMFGIQYRFDGLIYDADFNTTFNGGFFALQHLYLGAGLVLLLGLCLFYLKRQLPRRDKQVRNDIPVTQVEGVRVKTDFCSKCGAAASDGDFCAKCGNSLIGASSQSSLPNTYPAGRTSPLAIASIIIVFFVSWVGLVLGYLARKEIRESNGQLGGAGLVKAAIIIGWVATGLGILVGIVWAVAIGIAAGNAYSY